MKLAETYHFTDAQTMDEYHVDFEKHIHEKGTHAYVYSYLLPREQKMGKWWRSIEYIPIFNPYGVWITRINWYLNEV